LVHQRAERARAAGISEKNDAHGNPHCRRSTTNLPRIYSRLSPGWLASLLTLQLLEGPTASRVRANLQSAGLRVGTIPGEATHARWYDAQQLHAAMRIAIVSDIHGNL